MTSPDLLSNPHYLAAAEVLGDRAAARSGVPYLEHIREGVLILQLLEAGQRAQEAYCLHPLVQDDASLANTVAEESFLDRLEVDPRALVLAMEYRSIANRYLSWMELRSPSEIERSPLSEVNQMLVADKVQNRKDFEKHNRDHPRASHLARYFEGWLVALGVSEAEYQSLVRALDRR